MASVPTDLPVAPPREGIGACVSVSRVVFVLAALFLWLLVLQAPLRYGLARVHLEALIYLPKLLMLAAVVVLPFLRSRASMPALAISGLAVLYLLWGMVNLSSPAQAAFGFWVLVPLLFGLWAGSIIRIEQWRHLFAMLFVVSVLGVFLNPLLHYPWSGQTLDLLGKSIKVSRQWSAFGLDRYAGFARASFSAAAQLLLFGVMLVVLLQRRGVKLLVWLVAGAGIALTTTKGPLGAWLLLSMYFAGGALLRWPRYWLQLWLVALTFALLAMILLPLSTLWIQYDPTLHGYASKFLFASFGDRLNWMWPDSLHLLNLNGAWHWWTGRGLGGIGAAQQYFEPARYLAADNLFVYVTVYVGLPMALLLFVGLWWRVMRLSLSHEALAWRLPVILGLVAYGVVVNEIEASLLALFWGLALSAHGVKVDWR
ncbi:hypothetical protein ACJU26_03195 [Acidithiobacillus sp. M4-SHS-6]|uniref:hypothetical protein n=1 Tax=Acidithiobacillus sp. M4-SHS-6 TaxID=3383024 RepID=UPI0039BE009C